MMGLQSKAVERVIPRTEGPRDLRGVTIMVLFSLWLTACGVEQVAPEAPRPEAQPEALPEIPQQGYFTEGHPIPMAELDIESVQSIVPIAMECQSRSALEFVCGSVLKPQSRIREMAHVVGDALVFHKPGAYLVKAVHRDRSEEVLKLDILPQKTPSDSPMPSFALYRLRDSFYDSVSHFELRTPAANMSPFPIESVTWTVKGGRYHVLDTELVVLSKLQPFQKSILFKERETYEVTAEVRLRDGSEWRDSQVVDLRKSQDGDSLGGSLGDSPVGVSLNLERLKTPVGVPMNAWAEMSKAQEYGYRWEVRQLMDRTCPMSVMLLEDWKSLSVQMAYRRICEGRYEAAMLPGEDYEVQQEGAQASLLFKKPGAYVIRLFIESDDGQLLTNIHRQVTVYHPLVSRR